MNNLTDQGCHCESSRANNIYLTMVAIIQTYRPQGYYQYIICDVRSSSIFENLFIIIIIDFDLNQVNPFGI